MDCEQLDPASALTGNQQPVRNRRHRADNVAGAFALAPGGPGVRPLDGRWIVLVDDVVTTGSTLAACGATLMAAGALGVSAITVARER